MSEYIIGADEVGYGSWAGPLVVCAVRAPVDWTIPGLNDSKQFTSKKQEAEREALADQLTSNGDIEFSISEKSNELIDKQGLGVCLKEAYVEVISDLLQPDDKAIIDGTVKIPSLGKQVTCLVKADTQIPTVMAASIIAKVYRDRLMIKLAIQYPGYDWENNVGYGTKKHKEGIRKLGMSSLHRKSYNIKL